jgi:hypothetical protein
MKLIPMPSEELYPRVRVRWCDAIDLSSDSPMDRNEAAVRIEDSAA